MHVVSNTLRQYDTLVTTIVGNWYGQYTSHAKIRLYLIILYAIGPFLCHAHEPP